MLPRKTSAYFLASSPVSTCCPAYLSSSGVMPGAPFAGKLIFSEASWSWVVFLVELEATVSSTPLRARNTVRTRPISTSGMDDFPCAMISSPQRYLGMSGGGRVPCAVHCGQVVGRRSKIERRCPARPRRGGDQPQARLPEPQRVGRGREPARLGRGPGPPPGRRSV